VTLGSSTVQFEFSFDSARMAQSYHADKRATVERRSAAVYLVASACYALHMPTHSRITINHEVMGGKPCIRGRRVTVGMIVEALASGRTERQLLEDFPYLKEPDIRETLWFAANLVQGRSFPLAS